MDDEDTQSYDTADIECDDLSASGTQPYDTDREAQESGESEECAIPSGNSSPTAAHTILPCPSMSYPVAALLDAEVLAQYLLMLEIPIWMVSDAGTHWYFMQYEHSPTGRTEVSMQLEQEIRNKTLSEVIALFDDFLEGSHRESFYREIYRQFFFALQERLPTGLTPDFPYDLPLAADTRPYNCMRSAPPVFSPDSDHIGATHTVIQVLDSDSEIVARSPSNPERSPNLMLVAEHSDARSEAHADISRSSEDFP